MTTAAEITALLKSDSSLEEMRNLLIRARKQLAKKEEHDREMIEAVYLAAKDSAYSHPLPKVGKRPAVKDASPEVALLHLTDWQYGKRTEDFTREVCEDRISQCVGKTIHITNLHRATRPVTECHVMLGGDMIEGMTIFATQPYEIEAGIFDQVFGVARLISSTIQELLLHFDRVVVWEEYGNHGRIGRFGELPGSENLDRMAYAIARQQMNPRLEKIGGLEWHPATSWYMPVTVGNYRALLVHGDEIRSFGGNHPSYGIVKKVQSWAAGVIEPFHDCYMGHFHRPDTYTLSNAGSIYLTGSVESSSQYAAEFVGALSRPSQRLHFIDPGAGRVTSEYRLWLD